MYKYIFFFFHYCFIIYTIYPFSSYNSIIAIIVYLSWLFNNNYCILTQLEYKYFNETCLFLTIPKPISKYEKILLLSSQIIKILFTIIF